MSTVPELPAEVIARLTLDAEPWLSCDDCFEQLDVAVERALLGEALGEPFAAHLRGCPACRDEAHSLAALVAATLGLGGPEAVTRLDVACSVSRSRS